MPENKVFGQTGGGKKQVTNMYTITYYEKDDLVKICKLD